MTMPTNVKYLISILTGSWSLPNLHIFISMSDSVDASIFISGDSISEDKHGSSNRNANDSDDSPESSTSGKFADGEEKEWKRRPGG